MDVETPTATCLQLGRRQSDPQPDATTSADIVEESAPAAAEIEHTPSRADPDLLGDVIVLASLRLLEAHGEVPVVLGSAELGRISQAQPDHTVGQRIGELDIPPLSHRAPQFEGSSDPKH